MREGEAPTSAAAADKAAVGMLEPESATASKLFTESAGTDESSDNWVPQYWSVPRLHGPNDEL